MMSCLDGHIEFSYAQKGRAMTIHFASDKLGLRSLKPAINYFCALLFSNYDIKMILGIIGKDKGSIKRLANKLNFSYLCYDKDHDAYMRLR